LQIKARVVMSSGYLLIVLGPEKGRSANLPGSYERGHRGRF